MALASDFRHGRIAPDHGHDSLVVIVEGGARPARDLGEDVLRRPHSTLLCNRGELWKWPAVRARNVREVAERVHARAAGDREVRLHLDAAAMTSRQP